MTDHASNLKNVIRSMIDEVLPLRQLTVSAVGEDNTVNLAYGAGIIESVPCAASYSQRKVGDKVWTARSNAGNYEVLAKSEADPAEQAITADGLQDALDNLNVDIRGDMPPEWTLDWGTPSPGTGWIAATTMWMRSGVDGRQELYGQLASPALPPSTKPAKPAVKPRNANVAPVSRGSWRTSGQADPTVYQGDFDGRGAWTGAWFYGTSIAAACAGKTVLSMTLNLGRVWSGTGPGFNKGVPVRLHTHSNTAAANPTLLDGPKTPFKLQPNDSGTYTIPSTWRDDLASGAARGFAVSGDEAVEFMQYSNASAVLTITFAAA